MEAARLWQARRPLKCVLCRRHLTCCRRIDGIVEKMWSAATFTSLSTSASTSTPHIAFASAHRRCWPRLPYTVAATVWRHKVGGCMHSWEVWWFGGNTIGWLSGGAGHTTCTPTSYMHWGTCGITSAHQQNTPLPWFGSLAYWTHINANLHNIDTHSWHVEQATHIPTPFCMQHCARILEFRGRVCISTELPWVHEQATGWSLESQPPSSLNDSRWKGDKTELDNNQNTVEMIRKRAICRPWMRTNIDAYTKMECNMRMKNQLPRQKPHRGKVVNTVRNSDRKSDRKSDRFFCLKSWQKCWQSQFSCQFFC